jgi:hypothetical protein
MRIISAMCAVVVLAAAAWAQTPSAPAGDICRVFFVKPKPGMDQQLEAGRKKHMQFHKSHNDTWTWNTYLIETGMNTGTYVTSTCGHTWADFDDWEKRLGAADAADANANMGPYEQHAWSAFYRFRGDLGLRPTATTAPMSAVYVYKLHLGKSDDFEAIVKKVGEALNKANFPATGGWLQLVNGGEGPMFVLILERNGWAGFAPTPKSVPQIVEEAYGKAQADALWKTFYGTVAQAFSEAATYRPDLSYVPGK